MRSKYILQQIQSVGTIVANSTLDFRQSPKVFYGGSTRCDNGPLLAPTSGNIMSPRAEKCQALGQTTATTEASFFKENIPPTLRVRMRMDNKT